MMRVCKFKNLLLLIVIGLRVYIIYDKNLLQPEQEFERDAEFRMEQDIEPEV